MGCRSWSADKIPQDGTGVSAGSEFGGGFEAEQACDNVPGTRWSAAGGKTTEWWQCDFGAASHIVSKVSIQCQNGQCKNINVQGSDSGASWTTVQAIQQANNNNEQEHEITNDTTYRYWRLDVQDQWAAVNAVGAAEVEFHVCDTWAKTGGTKGSSLTPVASPGLKVDARKPYVYNDRHVSKMFSIPDRYIKQIIDKESEFEKPYLDWGYQKMQLSIPAPDWPGIRVPRIRTRHPRRPEIWFDPSAPNGPGFDEPEVGYGTSCVGCIINCTHPPTCNDEGTTVECHASQFCTQDSSGKGNDTTWGIEILAGDVIEERPGSWFFPSIEYEIDTTQPQFVAVIRFQDGLGYVCQEEIDIQCCNCLTAGAVSVADGTIAPGSTAAVTASGGCPPYTWDVAGTGYSLEFGVTEDGNNTLTSAGGVCGDGNDYSPYATVTAVDLCNDSDSGDIRNTGGQWVEKSTGACTVSGATNDGAWATFYRTEDNKRQTQILAVTSGSGAGQDCAGAGACGAVLGSCPDTIECTDCLSGMVDDQTHAFFGVTFIVDSVCTCYDESNCGGGGDNCWACYCTNTLAYDEWECPP